MTNKVSNMEEIMVANYNCENVEMAATSAKLGKFAAKLTKARENERNSTEKNEKQKELNYEIKIVPLILNRPPGKQ